jgi:hypothetical protein
MRTLVVLISVFLFCLSGIAGNLDDSWMVTKEGKMECKKVSGAIFMSLDKFPHQIKKW